MQKYLFLMVLVFAGAVVTQAQEKADANSKKLPQVNVGGIDDKAGGTVTGVVRFKGQKPEPKPLTDLAGNSFCKNCYKDGQLPQRDNVVFGKNGSDDTLQNVLVYVSKGLEGKK